MNIKTNQRSRLLRYELIWVILVTLIFSFILFGNVIKGGFVLDDHVVIEGRAELSNPLNLPRIFKVPWVIATSTFRPLTLWSFALNLWVSKDPAGFHVVNIFLYAASVVLVFLIVRKNSSRRAAYLTAILFLFLPIHTEAVDSIVGRRELLGTFLVLLALILFFNKKHIKASIAFFLALLASDFSIAFLPLVAVLLLIENFDFKVILKNGWYYLAPLPAYFLMRFWALGTLGVSTKAMNPLVLPMLLPFKERVFTGFYNFFLYLKKTIYPIDLSPDYSFNQIPPIHNILLSAGALIGIVIFITLVLLLIFLKRKDYKISLAIFLVTFLVMSDTIFISGGSVAERRWYLPSLGLVWFVSILVDQAILKWSKMKFILSCFGGVILLFFSVIIINQNRVWVNDHNLFTAAAERSPNSVFARTGLASVYFNEKNYDGAKQQLEAAFKISDKIPLALNIWGKLKWRDGKYDEAEQSFKKALTIDYDGRNSRSIYRTLALLEFDNGNNQRALSYLEQAMKSPSPTSDQEWIQIDQKLYDFIKRNQYRAFNSYSPQEIQEISQTIKSLMGF